MRHSSTGSRFLCSPCGSERIQKFFLLFVKMARRKDHASPEELTKVLNLLQKKPPPGSFYSMTTEQQIAEQEELLTEMILLTPRPTSSWVSSACQLVWQRADHESIGKFATAITFCSKFCFQKSLQVTTGAKLSPAVKRIVQLILRSSSRPLSTGDKLRRNLKRVL